MEDNLTMNDKTCINTDKKEIFDGESFVNEKGKSHKGSTVLYYINECNDKKKEMEKLYEDMKDAHIKLAYDIKEKKFDYKEIKIGQKNYNKINDIGNNEIPRDKYVDGFITFFEELEEKIENNYNKKVNFELNLDILGDKDLKLKCLYTLIIKEGEGDKEKKSLTNFKDFDILNNGPSEGFDYLLYLLNHHYFE